MTYFVLALTALVASGLTFFTGFGLGTLLLPAFAMFFPPSTAVTLTAVVHFLNGAFKLALVGRYARWRVVFAFGVPATLAAGVGARLLFWLNDLTPVATYAIFAHRFSITPVKLVIGLLMAAFAAVELSSRIKAARVASKWLPVGGVISGFFGGLSGHQGAFRSAFLVRANLDARTFVATSAAIALGIDVTRLAVYARSDAFADVASNTDTVLTATAAAFAGALVGTRLLEKTTLRSIQLGVSILLFAVACGMVAGVL